MSAEDTPAWAKDLPPGLDATMVADALWDAHNGSTSGLIGFGHMGIDTGHAGELSAKVDADISLTNLMLYHHGGLQLLLTQISVDGVPIGNRSDKGFPVAALGGRPMSLYGHVVDAGQTVTLHFRNESATHAHVSAGMTCSAPRDSLAPALRNLLLARKRGSEDDYRQRLIDAVRQHDAELAAKSAPKTKYKPVS